MLRTWKSLLGVVLALGVAASGAGPAEASLGHAGRWITDSDGRVVIVHGTNMVYKRAPFYPAAAGFNGDDAEYLRSLGMNAVRVGVIWQALEPEPGVFDDAYVAQIDETVEQLAAQGIYSLLDMHQDVYSERFEGEGAPEWAVQDDGRENPHNGFPGNYQTNPALQAAFDHFMANSPGPEGIGLQDYYAGAWQHLAQHFAGNAHVLGFEIFNEPFPGTSWASCLNTCPESEAKLTSFNRLVAGRIREVDTATPIYYEPYVFFDYGVPTTVGALNDPNAGFAFHDYCLTPPGPKGCPSEKTAVKNAVAHVKSTGEALLMTEFGDDKNEGELDRLVALADKLQVPWLNWAYCACEDPTGTDEAPFVFDPTQPPTGSNVDEFVLDTLVEPYPQLVSGVPSKWRYERTSDVFTFKYRVRRADRQGRFPVGSITRIAVPPANYPAGYTVRAEGATVVSAPNAPVLELAQTTTRGAVSVTVSP